MTDSVEELATIYESLNDADRAALLAFAQFLAQRGAAPPVFSTPVVSTAITEPTRPEEPQPIARPESESVIKALKRLSATYPMLNKNELLGETSDLVTQHVVMGRDKLEVIDALEAVFQRHYQDYLGGFDAETLES